MNDLVSLAHPDGRGADRGRCLHRLGDPGGNG